MLTCRATWTRPTPPERSTQPACARSRRRRRHARGARSSAAGSPGCAFAGVALAAFGLVLVFGPNKNAPPVRVSTTPADVPETLVKAPLTNEARRVAMRFIQTAVARENLEEAWTLVGPKLRGGLTKAQWVTGENPVVPYPDRQARRRALQDRRVVHEERPDRGRAPAAQELRRAGADLLPRAEEGRRGAGRPAGSSTTGCRAHRRSCRDERPRRPVAPGTIGAPPGLAAPARCPGRPTSTTSSTATAIEARGYWASVWLRLRRDKLAIAGGVFIVLLFVTAFAGAPLAVASPRPRPERAVPRLRRPRRRPAPGRARGRTSAS